MSIIIDIAIESESWSVLDADNIVRRAAAAALQQASINSATISIVLSDDEHIRELNKHHRGIDKPTNVLSFPAASAIPATADAPRFLGDIVIAFETTAREATDEAKPLENHVSHLIVHGVLHLFGFDHETDTDAETMEDRERLILSGLGIPDPYSERGASAGAP